MASDTQKHSTQTNMQKHLPKNEKARTQTVKLNPKISMAGKAETRCNLFVWYQMLSTF